MVATKTTPSRLQALLSFTYTGAIVSHVTTGYDTGEVGVLAVMTALTVVSWALRPPSRRTHAASPGRRGDRSGPDLDSGTH